jgi:hypothetical protein
MSKINETSVIQVHSQVEKTGEIWVMFWRLLSVFSGTDVGIAFMPCFASCHCQASRSTWIVWSATQAETARLIASDLCGLVISKRSPPSHRLYQDRTVAFFSGITWGKRSHSSPGRSAPSIKWIFPAEAQSQLQPRRWRAERLRFHSLAAEAFMNVTIAKALSGKYSHVLWSEFFLTILPS